MSALQLTIRQGKYLTFFGVFAPLVSIFLGICSAASLMISLQDVIELSSHLTPRASPCKNSNVCTNQLFCLGVVGLTVQIFIFIVVVAVSLIRPYMNEKSSFSSQES